jgi:hypothetical protein
MIHIQKNRPPRRFSTYAADPHARFDTMDTDTKSALRNALLEEQSYLCAYCMTHLTDKVKIEHYVPRNEQNQLQYMNLLAVCSGGEGLEEKQQTCDTKKRNTVLHIDPRNAGHIAQIYYKPSGRICADHEEFQRDLDQVLNLNVDRLVNSRRDALEELKVRIFQRYGGTSASREYLERILRKYQSNAAGQRTPYCGILIWYLQRRIRQCS